jgi:phage terminase small subunit
MTTATEYTFDDDCYSDLHKDVYGFRPRQTAWFSMTDAEKQVEWDFLVNQLGRVIEEEKQQQAEAVVEFEALVVKTIESGAKDRATALNWIMDASICNGDWEFLCFEHGIPYGYFK